MLVQLGTNFCRNVCQNFSTARMDKQLFANVIRYGIFARSVVWPCIPVLLTYQYIRQKDREYYALELLSSRLPSYESGQINDSKLPCESGHWRIQDDMRQIHEFARQPAQ